MEDVDAAVRSALVLFICVGTPQREDGQADLTQVEAVARVVARNLNGYKLIVEKSTVPAMTAQWLKKTILRYGNRTARVVLPAANELVANQSLSHQMADASAPDFDVASNPEFLQEGKAVENFLHPDRVVCGVESARAREILSEIYRPLQCPLVMTTVSTAEITKHAANAFLATKISFINMVADLCEKLGADVTAVARGIGLDPRIGPDFLNPGIGFGGYCFPKDLRAFIHLAKENGLEFSLLEEVERINLQRVGLFVQKVRQALWILRGKTIGILGLAFKPGTDDIREAPSLKIVQALLEEGSILRMHDPQATPNAQQVFPEARGRVTYCTSAYEAARGAHALLLLTEWEEFRRLDLIRLRHLMELPVLVDGRDLYDPETARQAGFEYHSVGRAGAMNPALHSSVETRVT
jgi:UDPglucose 6-dehydrogenase